LGFYRRVAGGVNGMSEGGTRSCRPREGRSNVEVQGEFRWGGTKALRFDLALHLVLDPGLDYILGEHISLQKESMVLLQGLERLLQRARQGRDLAKLLCREPVNVFVERLPGIDSILDAVQACHEHGGVGDV